MQATMMEHNDLNSYYWGNKMSNKNHNQESYLEQVEEMQDKQFVPGYYTGGRIPPYLKNPPYRPKINAMLFFLSAVPIFSAFVMFLILGLNTPDTRWLWVFIPVLLLTVLYGALVIKYLKMKPKKSTSKNKKKRKNVERK